MAIQGRAYTYYRREPDDPDFGLGLPDGLASPTLSATEWQRRLDTSFANVVGYEAMNISVAVNAGNVRLNVDFEKD